MKTSRIALLLLALAGAVGTEGFGEPVLARVSRGAHDGRLLILMRTGRELYAVHSDDAGLTWSHPEPVRFPGIDIFDVRKWERYFPQADAEGVPSDQMFGAEVDPDLIEMKNGTLVCAVGVRVPQRLYHGNWHAPQNGDYLAFSCDGGDNWSHVVQIRSGKPTSHYMGVREIAHDVLYVVYDDSVWKLPVPGGTLGFTLTVHRTDLAAAAESPGPAPRTMMLADPNGGPDFPCAVYPTSPAARGRAGLVVHLYGRMGSYRKSNIARRSFEVLRRLLAERGYWIAVPELGPENWMSPDACAKLDTVIDQLTRRESIEPARVHLLGVSMGASGSLLYAMRRPGKIASLVAIFPVTDFRRWWAANPAHRAAFDSAQNITPERRTAMLAELSPLLHPEAFRPTPIFLLHGDRDTTVPPFHSRELAAALVKAGAAVVYREIAGGYHRDEFVEPYQREIADFLTAPDRRAAAAGAPRPSGKAADRPISPGP